jgi:hypothetical protein
VTYHFSGFSVPDSTLYQSSHFLLVTGFYLFLTLRVKVSIYSWLGN